MPVNDCTALTETLIDAAGTQYDVSVPPTDLVPAPINTAAGGNVSIAAATVGQRARLYRLWLQVDAATTISFYDGPDQQPLVIKCPGAMTIKLDLGLLPWAQSSINISLFLNSTNAVQITGCAYIAMAAS